MDREKQHASRGVQGGGGGEDEGDPCPNCGRLYRFVSQRVVRPDAVVVTLGPALGFPGLVDCKRSCGLALFMQTRARHELCTHPLMVSFVY